MAKITELIAQADKPFYSLEFFPPKEEAQLPDFFKEVERLKAMRPLFVSVTFGAGGSRQSNTLGIANMLRDYYGLEPMTHLTCVASRRDQIREYLDNLRRRGIANILALRGDAPAQARGAPPHDWSGGDFRHASDLIAFIREEFPDLCIGAACYPGAHPESPSRAADRLYTRDKILAGADFLVTQLFFDTQDYVDFVRELRVLGVDKPVLPGIMPARSLESLRHVTDLCGVAIPSALRRVLEEAKAAGGEAAVREAGARYAAEQARALIAAGAPGVHLYTLNKSETCLRIVDLAGLDTP